MKKLLYLFLICFVLPNVTNAQGSNPCGKNWSEWRTAWNLPNGEVEYRLEFASKKCGCGYNYVELKHSLPYDVKITVRLQGYDCDGKPYGERFFSDAISGGEISKKGSIYHWFASMPNATEVILEYEEGGKRIRLEKNNTGTKKYINGMSEAAYNQQQQQKSTASSTSLNNKPFGGTANNSSTNTSSQVSGSTSGTASNQIVGNNNAQPQNSNVNSGNTQKSTYTQSTQISNSNSIASQRVAQTNAAASQQAILQNMVSQDLLKAQQSTTSPILQSMYLSNARLAAVAAGDQSTVSRIAQQQQQLRLQSQQQLTESVTQLAGTVFSLISAAQDRKREEEARRERWRIEDEQRKSAVALKIAETEQKTAPQRQLALEQLEQRMNSESVGYGNAATAADKVSYALSWLWKWNESIKIAGTKPEVRTSYSNPTDVSVVSEGYVNASSQSLLSAVELTENLTMANLAGYGIVSNEVPKFLYPIDYPYNAKKFNDKRKFWNPRRSKKNTTVDKIELNYMLFEYELKNFNNTFKERVSDLYTLKTIYYYSDVNKYPIDSAECVLDGGEKYRHWKANNWKNAYDAGYVTQKKLEANLLHASLILDSAIGFNTPAALSRSAEIYRSAFEWYFNGPVRWLKVETQPALLIRESMWRYALAVAATRKNMPPSENTEDPHAAITEAFVKQFEQYLQQPISQVTEPMKLDKK